MDDMQFHSAPEENLKVWSGVIKLFSIASLVTAVALLLMAGFLT